ncbi:hypothetical protein AK830_g8697 [Neonectria ditissima]|uniref:Heterokaryon incompatibility domain-containing protein n=1 Tax=Neonectria ditissima TaxID=78410 RepID=A0A0N8H633_9HYPO|nr:hypothetical protein AK830_g8697 [Neonectria ditissima]
MTETRPAHTSAHPVPSESDDYLCERCADIDLEKVFRGGYKTPHEISDLGPVPEDQLKSPCSLCRLIATAVYKPFGDDSLASFHDSCSTCNFKSTEAEADSTLPSYRLFAVNVSPEKGRDGMWHSRVARYQSADLLVESIQKGHWFSKSEPQAIPAPPEVPESGEFIALKVGHPQIQNLCFIDCQTRRLMGATAGQEYIALSYVWGEPDKGYQSSNLAPDEELPEAPLVIDDAIRVVIAMGYRYLWVDRYCIQQSDIESLEDHLSKMHLLYQNAVFAIVAAAGTDSSFGLPGVSKTAREPQTYTTVGSLKLVSAIEPFANDTRCKWNTRAWTYQEGLFATRRLIFGPRQVSFHCMRSEQSEIYAYPASWAPKSLPGSRQVSVWEHITRYSTRALTYDSDALNGLAATLNSFNKYPESPVANIWGIPFSESITSLDQSWSAPPSKACGSSRMNSDAVFASPSAISGYSLMWSLSGSTPDELRTLRRRKDFPTWSWASCVGHICFPGLWSPPRDAVLPDPELDLAVETLDGQTISISDYLATGNSPKLSRYLHIEAWSVRDALTFHCRKGTASLNLGDAKYELTGPIRYDSMSNHNDHTEVFRVLSERRNSMKRWEAIISWFSPMNYGNVINPYLLILIKSDDPKYPGRDVYERVGSIPAMSLERMPKKRRRAAASTQREQRPRPTMKWAAEIIEEARQADIEAARKHREWLAGLESAHRQSDDEGGHTKDNVANPSTKGSGADTAGSVHEEPSMDNESPEDRSEHTESELALSLSDVSSEDTDSDDTGDYTINNLIQQGLAKKYYPRIPVVRRKLIIQ